ncbi:MAG: dTDP-4-dehydrorhamnose reductase [Chitinophagaceae bacterium]|nr:dTDP-4-dehydrorhamnose reductase [Chitinophagaceae bacterium]
MNNNHIVVTGANGQVGQSIKLLSDLYPDVKFSFLTRYDLSISDREALNSFFQNQKPTVLINCAAYTAVDKAESEQELALEINATAVETLASICKEFNTRFIHISTDYVFDGNASIPYKESDPTNPVNYYGFTKLQGENLAIAVNHESIIVRTSWVYAPHGKNFVKTMLKLMQDRTELNVVGDQFGSPTYAPDLAEALLKIALSDYIIPGIYHFSNDGIITWFDFATAIAEISHSSCKVNAITTSQYPTPAKRPSYSGLNKTKIQADYSIQLKPWRDSLQDCIQKLNA